MADLEGISSHIRFQLSQMRAKNQQHELERLAFHLARATVTANILPATGPVQAGGDQGRDFETFRSYLRTTDIAESAFAARVSARTIAFACSLEQNITPKIKEDVDKILAGGATVDEVHYYCEVDLPVAKRHAVQDWARVERKGLHLEIHDGQAIATELSNEETFWIAQRFLGVPAEVYPRVAAAEPDSWYEGARVFWKRSDVTPRGAADFATIRKAARFALCSDDFTTDLPFWIQRLEVLRATASSSFKHRIETEAIVLVMRSTRALAGYEGLVREYFTDVAELSDPLDLHNAATSVAYAVGSVVRCTCSLTADEVLDWQRQLIARVEVLLADDSLGKSTRADLLETAGSLELTLPNLLGEGPGVDRAMARWMELAALLPEAPLFNLSLFSDNLAVIAPLLVDHSKYPDLTAAVDGALQTKLGAIAVGEKGRDRAIALHDAGRILRAIEELHRVKVQWFAEESLRGAILAMMMLSSWYHELRLYFAAKYYALAAATLLVRRPKFHGDDLLGRALVEVGRADFGQGAFANLLGIVEVTTAAFNGAMPADEETLPERLWQFLVNLCTTCVIAEKLDAATGQSVETVLTSGPLAQFIKEGLPFIRARWETASADAMWERLEHEIVSPPFSDVGAQRTAMWLALGVTWRIHWDNDYGTAAIAEEFCAVLQVVIADLAATDLCLLPTTVDVTVTVCAGAKPHLEDFPSNVGRQWVAVLPPTSGDVEELQLSTLAMAATMLRDCSLLPNDQFHAAIEDGFRRGITMKTFVARPYRELFRDVLRPSDFSLRDKIHAPAFARAFASPSHDALRWIDRLGPTYDLADAEEQVKTRYERTMTTICHTLNRLKSRKSFKRVVHQLRDKGWRDWHILTALMNVAVNYRVNRLTDRSEEDMRTASSRLLDDGETKNDPPIPPSAFTPEALHEALELSWLSTLRHNDLDIYQTTPDFPAIGRFLAARYRYWEIDTPHDDPFL